jgi:hypothetical protein
LLLVPVIVVFAALVWVQRGFDAFLRAVAVGLVVGGMPGRPRGARDEVLAVTTIVPVARPPAYAARTVAGRGRTPSNV